MDLNLLFVTNFFKCFKLCIHRPLTTKDKFYGTESSSIRLLIDNFINTI